MSIKDNVVDCSECGRPLSRDPDIEIIDADDDNEFDGIWFEGVDSPTGKPICSNCFDQLPCDGCRGL